MCPGHGGKMLKEVERLYNCAIICSNSGWFMSKPLVQLGGQDTSSWRRLCSGKSDLWGVTPLASYIYMLAWVWTPECFFAIVWSFAIVLYKLHLDWSLSNTRRTFMTFLLLLCAATAVPCYSIMGGVLDIFWCKTFIPKRLYAKNGMKSISIHVSTTFGATSRTWRKWLLQMQEMKSLDKGQFSKKRYAIFFEASAKVHEALTLACKFCVCVGGWVSCVRMSCVCSRCLDGFRYLSW